MSLRRMGIKYPPERSEKETERKTKTNKTSINIHGEFFRILNCTDHFKSRPWWSSDIYRPLSHNKVECWWHIILKVDNLNRNLTTFTKITILSYSSNITMGFLSRPIELEFVMNTFTNLMPIQKWYNKNIAYCVHNYYYSNEFREIILTL